MPTIKPKVEFDVKLDAKMLHSILQPAAVKKAPDATARSLIQILTTRSYAQRQSIVATYREFYGRYIAQDIRGCMGSGCLRDGLLTLVRPYAVRDATAIHKALTGVGKDQHTLLEILCSRKWEELQEVCKVYKELFKQDLSKTIKSELFGKLEGFLQMMLRERRSEAPVEDVRVKEAVRDLHDVAGGKWGKEKHLIASMFVRESYPQLREIFREYKRRYNHSIHTLIERHMVGQTARMIAYIARYVESEVHYYAHILHKAVNGEIGDKSALHRAVMGNTSEKAALMRVVLRQCDINLQTIISVYEDHYGSSLCEDICLSTHGDFRDLLMAVFGWPWPVRRPGLSRTGSSQKLEELEAEANLEISVSPPLSPLSVSSLAAMSPINRTPPLSPMASDASAKPRRTGFGRSGSSHKLGGELGRSDSSHKLADVGRSGSSSSHKLADIGRSSSSQRLAELERSSSSHKLRDLEVVSGIEAFVSPPVSPMSVASEVVLSPTNGTPPFSPMSNSEESATPWRPAIGRSSSSHRLRELGRSSSSHRLGELSRSSSAHKLEDFHAEPDIELYASSPSSPLSFASGVLSPPRGSPAMSPTTSEASGTPPSSTTEDELEIPVSGLLTRMRR